MKKWWILTLALALFTSSFAQNLSAVYEKKVFCTDQLEPYVQLSFFVRGSSLIYQQNEDKSYSAQVRITIKIYEDTTVINTFDHILASDKFTDNIASTKPNFADIRNMKIPSEGIYTLSVSMKDVHDTLPASEILETFNVYYSPESVSISEISLLNSLEKTTDDDIFNKYGYSTFPLFYGNVGEDMANLPFFFEIYNTDRVMGEGKSFVLKLYVEDDMTRTLALPSLYSEVAQTTGRVKVILNQLGIFQLPSGNYNLVAEVWSDTLLMARERAFFKRTNPKVKFEIEDYQNVNIANAFMDSIVVDTPMFYQYLSYLYPIATPIEKEFINGKLEHFPIDNLKRYFYSFWLSRSPDNPQLAWKEYLKMVNYVNEAFGDKINKGYRTDRGRVYLQYGPPDNYQEVPYDSHSYPYEIWHYYQMRDQNNVKFVFYNPDLVTNDYELLHSDKYGEIKDPFWQIKLSNRKKPIYDLDNREPDDYWGGSIKEDWRYH